MRFEMNNGCIMFCDAVAIYDIYSVDIDEEEKSIEMNDANGFLVANISDYSEVEEVGFVEYDNKESLKPFGVSIIKNGEMNNTKRR